MRSRPRFEPPDAEALSVQALAFLAADEGRLARFLALTGLDPATIRAAAASPGFPAAVLDHIAGDERLLLAFAEASGVAPETVMAAQRLLAPHEPFE